jgi:hypothetical protein
MNEIEESKNWEWTLEINQSCFFWSFKNLNFLGFLKKMQKLNFKKFQEIVRFYKFKFFV